MSKIIDEDFLLTNGYRELSREQINQMGGLCLRNSADSFYNCKGWIDRLHFDDHWPGKCVRNCTVEVDGFSLNEKTGKMVMRVYFGTNKTEEEKPKVFERSFDTPRELVFDMETTLGFSPARQVRELNRALCSVVWKSKFSPAAQEWHRDLSAILQGIAAMNGITQESIAEKKAKIPV